MHFSTVLLDKRPSDDQCNCAFFLNNYRLYATTPLFSTVEYYKYLSDLIIDVVYSC